MHAYRQLDPAECTMLLSPTNISAYIVAQPNSWASSEPLQVSTAMHGFRLCGLNLVQLAVSDWKRW